MNCPETGPATRLRIFKVAGILSVLLGLLALVSLSTGTAGRGFLSSLKGILTGDLDPTEQIIIYSIRLPRVLLASVIGAALSASGSVFQALLRNPLADPYVLGVSGGAAAGAIVGILIGAGAVPFGISGFAFLGGALTIFLVFGIAKEKRGRQPYTLILAGVIVNAFFSAVIMFLISTSSHADLHPIVFWLMGDLGMADSGETLVTGLALLAGFAFIYLFARDMNLLVTGEDSARQLGVHVERVRMTLLVAASLLAGLAVAVSGIIAFVGLIVPHMMRLIFGSDHRLLLPSSLLFGAAFMLAADTAARTLLAPSELPVGVVTAVLGAPFFIYLLRKRSAPS